MKFALPFLMILTAPLSAQEEIPLEDVFRKIEARLKPIESMSGRVRILGGGEMTAELNIAGWIGCRPGTFLRKEMVLWKLPEGLFLKEECHRPSSVATRGIFTGTKGGQGLSFAFKASPEEWRSRRGGMTGMLEMMVGGDWALWEVALWPRQLSARYANLKAHREKRFVVITGDWEMPGFMQPGQKAIRLRWYFDGSTHRIEKMVAHIGKKPMEILCREYIRVQGVEIPSRIEYIDNSMLGRGGSMALLVLDRVESPAGKLATPNWLNDPALPEATDASLEDLEKRLKDDPTNGALVMELGNRILLDSRMMGRDSGEWAKKFREYSKPALDAHPGSSLLRLSLFVGMVMADKKVPGDILEEMVRRGDLAFDALAIAVMVAVGKSENEKAKALLERIPGGGVGAEFRNRVGFSMEIAAIKSAKEFMEKVGRALEGRSVSEKVSLLSGIAPPVRRFSRGSGPLAGKSVEFLKELADTGKPWCLLLAARGYAGQGKIAESVRLYVLLADDPDYSSHLKVEFKTVCIRGEEESIPLLEKISDLIEDPELLLIAVKNAFEKKEEIRFLGLKKRLIHFCVEADREEDIFPGFRNTDNLVPLLEKLMEKERIGDAKEILLAYVNGDNGANLFYGKSKELLVRILADDFAAQYRFLKYSRLDSHFPKTLGMTMKEFVTEIKRRVESGEFDRSEMNVLGKIVEKGVFGEKEGLEIGTIVSLLRKGNEKYPNEKPYRERLGDALCFAKEYADAVSVYDEVMVLRREGGGESRQVGMGSMISTSAGPVKDPTKPSFNATLELLSKMAYAYLGAGDREGAVKAIERFLEDFPGDGNIKEAADAYRVLKMLDQILPLKKRLFLKQVGETNRRGWRDPAVTTGMELVELYMEMEKFLEAHLVAELVLERKSEEGSPDVWKTLEKHRGEIRKKVGAEELIGAWLEFDFAPVSAARKASIDDLIEMMDDDQIDIRDEAFEKLRKMGPEISAYLAGEREGQGTEVASRLREILVAHAEKALRERFLEE
jgi:tetratricopeptide (TPR) repeat protein